MPKFHVTGPDGATYEVNAPDGASEQDAIAYAQKNLAGAQQAAPTAAPTDKSLYDQVNDFGNNMGDAFVHHLANIPVGVGQAAAHLANYVGNGGLQGQIGQQAAQDTYNHSLQGLVNPQQLDPSFGDKAVSAIDQAVAGREAKYQADVPTNTASTIGAGLGEVLPWLTGTGELRAAGALPNVTSKLGKLGLLAGEGGVMGAAQPVTDGDFAKAKAAQIGVGAGTSGLLGGAGLVAGAAKRGVMGALEPVLNPDSVVNENLARLYGSDPATLAKLKGAASLVPGEVPSAAQALQTPEAVQAERMFRNNPASGPTFVAQDNANNSARLGLLQGIAGDDAAMTAAQQARRNAVQPFIDANLPEEGSALVDPAAVIAKLKKLTTDGNDTVRSAAAKHLNLVNTLADQNGGKIPATDLDGIRQGVNGTLASVKPTGSVTPQEVVKYAPVANSITDAIDSAVPGYRNYLATYAKHSEPITTMDAVRGLLDPNAPGSLNAAGDPQLGAARLKQALRADDKANFGVSDAARTQLEAVRDSLMRRSISDTKVSASGPSTAADAQLQPSGMLARGIYGGTLGTKSGWVGRGVGSAVGGLLGSVGGPVGSVIGSGLGLGLTDAIGAANTRIVSKAGAKAVDAKATAAAIEAYLAKQPKAARQGLLSQYLLGISAPVAANSP